jgi:hypothetical protein
MGDRKADRGFEHLISVEQFALYKVEINKSYGKESLLCSFAAGF